MSQELSASKIHHQGIGAQSINFQRRSNAHSSVLVFNEEVKDL